MTRRSAGCPAVPQLVVPVDAPGVDAKQDRYAVPGAAGYLGSRYAGVVRQADAAVAKVVWPGSQWRIHLGRGQDSTASTLPGAAVGALAGPPIGARAGQLPSALSHVGGDHGHDLAAAVVTDIVV